jgi:hypothetical protein
VISNYDQELAQVAVDPEVRRYAITRTGDTVLAEDLISDTYCAIVGTDRKHSRDLRARFLHTLSLKIAEYMWEDDSYYYFWALDVYPGEATGGQDNERTKFLNERTKYLECKAVDWAAEVADDRFEFLVRWGEDIDWDAAIDTWPSRMPVIPVDEYVEQRVLGDMWLMRLMTYCKRFEMAVPPRSRNRSRYRSAIVNVAKQLIWAATYEYPQEKADDLLKAAYPDWLDESGVKARTLHRRISGARQDLRELLHVVIRRPEELDSRSYTGYDYDWLLTLLDLHEYSLKMSSERLIP